VTQAPPEYLTAVIMNPVLKSTLEKSVLLGLEPTAKPVKCQYHDGNKHLLVVTGENATGKSIVRRALSSFARRDGLEVIDISPEGKSRGGIVGALIYGTEEYQSTGSNSARTVRKALSTARSRTSQHVLILDEPDAGLSDEYAAGAGVEIAEFCSSCPATTMMTVVVSHRRALLSELAKISPSQLCLGGCPPLKDWLNRIAPPKSLEHLILADQKMFGAVLTARGGQE